MLSNTVIFVIIAVIILLIIVISYYYYYQYEKSKIQQAAVNMVVPTPQSIAGSVTYARGPGHPPPCTSGEDSYYGLCLPQCSPGYTASGLICNQSAAESLVAR